MAKPLDRNLRYRQLPISGFNCHSRGSMGNSEVELAKMAPNPRQLGLREDCLCQSSPALVWRNSGESDDYSRGFSLVVAGITILVSQDSSWFTAHLFSATCFRCD
jgi:hypothetical protein